MQKTDKRGYSRRRRRGATTTRSSAASPPPRDLRSVALERTRRILARHYPRHLPDEVDRVLRERFDIRLPRETMEAK